jgi:hypothetical protein
MIALLTPFVFSDRCPTFRTLPITRFTADLFPVGHSFSSAGDIYCVNITVPRVALSFVEIPDAFVEVWRNTDYSGQELFVNDSLRFVRTRSIDFGADTGLLVFTSLSQTFLAFSLVKFPAECQSHIISNVQSDVFRIDDSCNTDGCLGPNSGICYFRPFTEGTAYSMGVNLTENQSIADVCVRNQSISDDYVDCKHFTGDQSYNFSVRADGTDLAYLAVRNVDNEDQLSGFVSVNIRSNRHLGESRGRSDGSGLVVFYGEEPPPDPGGLMPWNAALVVLASMCFLLVVLAAIAYLTITHLQRAAEVAAPDAVKLAAARSADFDTVTQKPAEVEVDDGNPDMPPADL